MKRSQFDSPALFIQQFLSIAQNSVAYTVEPKKLFHLRGARVLRMLALALELPQGSYEVRSNKGGIAVSGEVTLHGENIYVQLSQSCLGIGRIDVMFRTVKGRFDYTGGRNHFMPFTALADFNGAVARIRQVKDGVSFQAI